MFTIRNINETNERGSLLIEAIALLGLMTMMSPMVVRQTAERTSEMEEVAIAGQLKDVRDALNSYIAAEYGNIAQNDTNKHLKEFGLTISANDLAPYLPQSLLDFEGDEVKGFKGNRLVDDYKIGIRVQCVEVRDKTGKVCTTTKHGETETACYSLSNGVVTSNPTGDLYCSQFKMTGLVLSDNTASGGEEIEERRASRIASMVGADGGFMLGSGHAAADGAKIVGTQGIWEENVSDISGYFDDNAPDTGVGGRLAATTTYTTGATSGSFLYRMKTNVPGGNSMFTDLDMGGDTGESCTNEAGKPCNKINNAGGLQVINGSITILSEAGRAKTNLLLNTTQAIVNVSDSIDFKADASALLSVNNKTSLNLTASQAVLKANNGASKLELNDANAILNAGTSKLDLSETRGLLQIHGGASQIELNTTTAVLNAGPTTFYANSSNAYLTVANDKAKLDLNLTTAVLNTGTSKLEMNTTRAYMLADNGSSQLDMGVFVNATAKTSTNKTVLNTGNTLLELATIKNTQTNTIIRRGALLKANNGASQLDLNDANATLNAGTSKMNMTTTRAYLMVKNGASMLDLNDANATLNAGLSKMNMNATRAYLLANNGASMLDLNNATATLNVGTTKMNLTSTQAVLQANNGASKLDLNNANAILNAGTTSLNLTTTSAILNSADTKIAGNISTMFLNSSGINMNVNGKGLFSLTQTDAKIDINGGTVTTNGNLQFNAAALTLVQNQAKIIFQSVGSNSKVSMFTGFINNGLGNYVKLSTTGSEGTAPVGFYTDSGRITGSFFEPERIMLNNGTFVNPIQGHKTISFQTNGQAKTPGSDTSSSSLVTVTGDGDYTMHKTYDSNNYKTFRVDPAFVSVMNDIKLTSRGGARLSEALPHYILKGIYQLKNEYSSGKWPCNSTNCKWKMPYYTRQQLGLTNGGYEFNCTDHGSTHPMKGTCAVSDNKYVTFNYRKEANYTTCNDRSCWAHPFLGKVPAPGYKVTVKASSDEVLYANEEGVCPDGYRVQMRLSPTSFEMGRVLIYNPDSNVAGAIVKYNYGYIDDLSADATRAAINLIQTSTRLRVTAQWCNGGSDNDPCTSGDRGWAVAGGVVTATGNGANDYKWNIGGIPTTSMEVLAYTYCVFQPQNFTMPNMNTLTVPNSGTILTPMDNPAINNNMLK